MFASRASILAIASAILSVVAGCATGPEPLPATMTDRSRIAYYEGVHRLSRGDYAKASEIFQALSGAPRHVRHATLAKLRLGDTMFYQGRFAEATEMYRSFANLHRGDPNVPYAKFRVAHSYFKRLPTEWFMSPPDHEMDQTLTQQAEAELTGFISLFPTSPYTPQARAMLGKTRHMLFRHELYAADFYASREAWQGVAWRLKDVFERFPEFANRDEKLGWRYVEATGRVGRPELTIQAIGFYLERFPETPKRERALAWVSTLRTELATEKSPEGDGSAPEKLDDVPAFRLNLPGSESPDGDEGTEEPDSDDSEEVDEDDESGSDEDDTEPRRLRPPELPPLEP